MKDKNGIEICCENCELYNGKFCEVRETYPECNKGGYFNPTIDAYKARIADLENKLTEIIKLLGERSRECGELEAYNKVLQRRIEEFSMELLDRTMKENKDVLERLKQAESEGK